MALIGSLAIAVGAIDNETSQKFRAIVSREYIIIIMSIQMYGKEEECSISFADRPVTYRSVKFYMLYYCIVLAGPHCPSLIESKT